MKGDDKMMNLIWIVLLILVLALIVTIPFRIHDLITNFIKNLFRR